MTTARTKNPCKTTSRRALIYTALAAFAYCAVICCCRSDGVGLVAFPASIAGLCSVFFVWLCLGAARVACVRTAGRCLRTIAPGTSYGVSLFLAAIPGVELCVFREVWRAVVAGGMTRLEERGADVPKGLTLLLRGYWAATLIVWLCVLFTAVAAASLNLEPLASGNLTVPVLFASCMILLLFLAYAFLLPANIGPLLEEISSHSIPEVFADFDQTLIIGAGVAVLPIFLFTIVSILLRLALVLRLTKLTDALLPEADAAATAPGTGDDNGAETENEDMDLPEKEKGADDPVSAPRDADEPAQDAQTD